MNKKVVIGLMVWLAFWVGAGVGDAQEKPEIFVQLGHSGWVLSVAFSPDDKYTLSGSADSTMRLWDINTGKEIVQMVTFRDGNWICMTPEGYYNSSADGGKYLNVRIGTRIYSIDQYRSTFYNPWVVETALGRLR